MIKQLTDIVQGVERRAGAPQAPPSPPAFTAADEEVIVEQAQAAPWSAVDETVTAARYEALLRADFAGFAHRAFCELNPRAGVRMNWHFEAIASQLAAVRDGRVGRLIVNVPPRHLKSHLASVSFPAWCLGHDPSARILCVSYAQDLADKLSRDCRRIKVSDWYQRLFPTRLSPQRQAVPEYEERAVARSHAS